MFREGARIFDPQDICPQGHQCCHFASDFRAFGKRQIRVCTHPDCKAVYQNGQKVADLEIHTLPAPPA